MANPSGPPTAFDSLNVGGVPTMGMGGNPPTTFGNYYFVDYANGSDGYGRSNTMQQPLKTVQAALNLCSTNNDDVICLRGNDTHVLSEMLAVSINRVHFVGLDGAWRPYGNGVKVQFTGTTGASNIGAMQNTGVRNSFSNIKWIQGSTITECLYTVVEGGEYAQYANCEVYQSENLDQTGAAEFVWNGDSTIMDNCTVGSLADAIGGTSILRPCVTLTAGLAGAGKVCRDGLIRSTRFWRQCKDTTNTFIYSANATDVERVLNLEHCGFINNKTATNLPAQCIKGAASLTVGQIVLDPLCYAANVTKISTTTGVIVTGAAPNSGTGIGVNAA